MANSGKKSKKKIFIFSGIGAVLLVLVLLVVLGTKKEVISTVQTEKVKRQTITQIVTASGKIQPEVQVSISPEVSGEIIALPVKVGQNVKKGDLLLRIKPDFYIAGRDQARASATSAKANMKKAEIDYNRAKGLHSKGLLSDAELDAAKTTYDVMRAQYEQAQASLIRAEQDLLKTTIYSPIDGTVSQLNSKLGERVVGTGLMAGTVVMVVADLSSMEARVDVDENDVVLVSLGDTARINVDAYADRKFTGGVYEIANTGKTKGLGTQEEVTNFEVKIRVLEKDIALRPGMSLTADIETATHHDVLAVPIQSVTVRMPKMEQAGQSQGGSGGNPVQPTGKKKPEEKAKEIVFVFSNGVVKAVPVKRGISNDTYVEILEGLKGDEEVVSGSYKAINRELEDGSKVKVDNTKRSFGAQKESK